MHAFTRWIPTWTALIASGDLGYGPEPMGGTWLPAGLQAPFTYEALPPEDIKFVPLKQTREFNAKELMQVGLPPCPM